MAVAIFSHQVNSLIEGCLKPWASGVIPSSSCGLSPSDINAVISDKVAHFLACAGAGLFPHLKGPVLKVLTECTPDTLKGLGLSDIKAVKLCDFVVNVDGR
ncbi:hypothetical protein E4U52_001125 [Claviceps spartinae]|nr:hypothetical protein E4U52_001125 [Claviceps spartinae]